ncbi:hypothetical protein IFM89_010514 [Coptis chinensis]|uniref:Uncharacterized protein n=1 Tax=Coptis chinensis TaxID=261450 RepID=A0A835LVJ0_9MAGN|nr:hypothetical protein IFM89_010514 [Coptis chinensis]
MDAEKELDIAVLDQYKAALNECAKIEKVDLSNFTCETFAKAFHQTFAKPQVIDRGCLGLFLQLAECLTTVSETLACIEIFHDFLLDISPHNLKWKRRSCLMDVMIGDVNYIRDLYGSDIAERLLSIIQDISSRDEADFQNFHKRARTCFERRLRHKSKSKVEVVVDPKFLKLRRSIEELFDQAGNCDITDDYNDELIDRLCSKVKGSLFSHSIVEVNTIAEMLHYYPEFKPLEDELVNYVNDDIVTDCLIDGLADGSSSYSTLKCQNQFYLLGENSPFKDINWVLLILEEIVTQLRTDTPSTISEIGLTRPEYVKIVTKDENAKIDEKINWISCVFSAELVAGGEAFPKSFKLYLERPNKVLTPESSKAFAMLGSELEQLVTFFNADE